jgi:GLPGLI family protein
MQGMKKIGFLFHLSLFVFCTQIYGQKIFSEGMMVYDILVQTGSSKPQMADVFDGAKTMIYVKGVHSRVEMINALGTSTTFFDSRAGNGILLKEYGTQKIMIEMNRAQWDDQNSKYDNIKYTPTNNTKTIMGYKCVQAEALMKDGTKFSVYYTPEIQPQNRDYNPQFKDLPGMPMEFETSVGDIKVRYIVSQISFDPLPANKFDTPKQGYRILSYEESKKMKG